MSRLTITALVAFALAVPVPAIAQAVRDKPEIALDSNQAYVVYTANKFGAALQLIRMPSAVELVDYKAKRDAALVKAHQRWERKFASWQRDVAGKKSGATTLDPGSMPIEPTDVSFSYPTIEAEMTVQISPLDRFAKGGGRSVYLQALPPGTYTLYGPISVGQDKVAMGTCMCLGTVRFTVEKGVITDLGRLTFSFIDALLAPRQAGVTKPKTEFDMPQGVTTLALEPTKPGEVIDPRIGSFLVKPAVYRPAGKLPNWYGIRVDRVTAIPGIFRYDRDKMIDLTAAPTP